MEYNDSIYEIRKGKQLKEGWLWPKYDNGCWRHLNKKGYANHPEIISDLCEDKSLVIQAGGNCGVYPKKFAQHFNSVVTFEPNHENFFCLTHNVPEKNVFKFQCFLGNETKPMGIKSNTDANNEYNAGAFQAIEGGIIPQVTIDSFRLKPSLIQLDLEGFEGNALQGAKDTILAHKPVVVVETNSSFSDKLGWSKAKINELMESYGYSIAVEMKLDTVYKHNKK